MSLCAFLPCRKGSSRVPEKNVKPFAGIKNGLVELKLKQLCDCESIDGVVLSTNDEEILSFASKIASSKLRIHRRTDDLCTDTTSTDELVAHAVELIPNGDILWTHVTSPFITTAVYQDVISRYLQCLKEGYDSLMTTTLIQAFLWGEQGPLNYDRRVENWPRTQTLRPVHEVNSGAFISSTANYHKFSDRIGRKPFLYTLDKITAHDIDWPEDFVIAEAIADSKLASL